MIWLPIIIIPIGPVLSLIWILENALMCLYIFYTNEPINKIIFLMVVIGTLGISIITAGTATYALVIIGLVGLLSNYKNIEIHRNAERSALGVHAGFWRRGPKLGRKKKTGELCRQFMSQCE